MDYKNLGGGSTAKPEKPVSKRTDGAAGGSSLKHNPSAAASHLREQDKCVPMNNGPMVQKGF